MIAEAAKRCSKCGEVKTPGEFYVSRNRKLGRESLDTVCKACKKVARHARYARLRDSGQMVVAKAGDERTCKTCGRVFLQRSTGAANNYCCRACYHARDNANRITCAHCGKVVKRSKKPGSENSYCSTECQYEASRVYRICQKCGERKPSKQFGDREWCRDCLAVYGNPPRDCTVDEWAIVVDSAGVVWAKALRQCITKLTKRDVNRQRAKDPWIARLDGIVGSLRARERNRTYIRRRDCLSGDGSGRDWWSVAYDIARQANQSEPIAVSIFGDRWVRKFRTTARNWQRKMYAIELHRRQGDDAQTPSFTREAGLSVCIDRAATDARELHA